MSELVFAYGSNMCSGRFLDYGVSIESETGSALLVGYRLVFNKLSRDGSGKANVESHPGAEVWGVLYSIPNGDLEVLDRGEGKGYCRERVKLVTTNGREIEAWVYTATHASTKSDLRPYTWYKRFLVEGGREHALPSKYVNVLEHIESIQDPDAEREATKRGLDCRKGEYSSRNVLD
jgi:gamma-glutamylcyclotransferase